MIVVREQFDADREPTNLASQYRSATDRVEMQCGVCGRPLYVGQDTKREIERAIEHDLGNPLICGECERNRYSLYFE
jgi:hypothetical protein